MTTVIDVIRPELHEAQQQIVDEAKRFNVLQCGRRFGKTTLGVDVAIDMALEGKPVGWFAPTYKILFDAWLEALAATKDIGKADKQNKRIALITGGVIEFWSLDTPDPGRSRKYARVIIDEAGIVRDLETVWTGAIRPTLTDYKGDAWFLGTPKGRNFFHKLFVRGQDEANAQWKSWRFKTVDNPHIDESEVAGAQDDLPVAAFQQEYLGEPADDGGNPFGLDAIDACARLGMPNTAPHVWGWDFAKSVDFTVGIALDKQGNVCRLERWQKPWKETIAEVLKHTARTPAAVDSTGTGDAIAEQLQRASAPLTFEPYVFSQPSKQRLMEGIAVWLQQHKGTIPKDSALHRELETFEYEYTRTGVRYTAPAGLHDDCVMAYGLAIYKMTHLIVRDLNPRSWAVAHA